MRELRTYTSLWGMEKRLYKFYDINLPYPVSIKQIGFFLGTLIPWFFIMNTLGVPLANPWYVLWIAPPFAAAYFGNKEVAEGKKLGDYALSQFNYFSGNRTFVDLQPAVGDLKLDEQYEFTCVVWRENPDRANKTKSVKGSDRQNKDVGKRNLLGWKKSEAENDKNAVRSKKVGKANEVRRKNNSVGVKNSHKANGGVRKNGESGGDVKRKVVKGKNSSGGNKGGNGSLRSKKPAVRR